MSCSKLAPSDPEFQAEERRFRANWNPGKWGASYAALPAPAIDGVWRVHSSRGDYIAKQESLKGIIVPEPGAGPGNEHMRFHGTSLTCGASFSGNPCPDDSCGICGILRSGAKMLLSKVGSKNEASYGHGIYVTTGSHTAKGYGGRHQGASLDGFHRGDDGNALVVCSVLMGKVEAHEVSPGVAPPGSLANAPPAGFHSRFITKRGTRNDEQVLFSEDQVLPKYILTFRA